MIFTFSTIMLITIFSIFDEVKKSKMVNYLKLVDKIASQVNTNDMEWTKNLIHINWNEYYKKQNRSSQAPQKFVCPFSDDREIILINQ